MHILEIHMMLPNVTDDKRVALVRTPLLVCSSTSFWCSAIRKTKKTMNRDEGAYTLSQAYDTLLKPWAAGRDSLPSPP